MVRRNYRLFGSIDANGYLKADEDWVTKTYNKKEKEVL